MGVFGNTFGLPHLIIILVIILLLFGAPKLPGLAKSIGQSMKIFRSEIKDPSKGSAVDATTGDATTGEPAAGEAAAGEAAAGDEVVDETPATPAKKSQSS